MNNTLHKRDQRELQRQVLNTIGSLVPPAEAGPLINLRTVQHRMVVGEAGSRRSCPRRSQVEERILREPWHEIGVSSLLIEEIANRGEIVGSKSNPPNS